MWHASTDDRRMSDQGDEPRWRIHTGPFPFVAPPFDGEIWLWRITDGVHFTAVTVKLARSVCDADAAALVESARSARFLRGRDAVTLCLNWPEPPREIAFEDPGQGPRYWGGTPTNSHRQRGVSREQ